MNPLHILHLVRFHTTFYLHTKACKNSWYKEWHQWRLSHHFHVAMLVFYLTTVILGSVSSFLIPPKSVLASTSFDWDLNTSSEYTYNADEVQFTGAVAQPSRDDFVTDATIYGTYCVDANTCYFVGSGGVILKTIDGGTSFTTQTSGTAYDLKSISCKTNAGVDTCYVVGNHGTIIKTSNSGATWSSQTSGITNNLNGVHFIDESVGYAVGNGGKILKTINGGTNWSAQTSGVTDNLDGVYFTDVNNGYATGELGNVLKTTNGGTNWTTKIWGWGGYVFNAISCTSTNTCYAVGTSGTGGLILKTTDGFTTYSSQHTGLSNTFYGVHFTDANNGYVVGANRIVLKTTNGGTNWATLVSDTDFNLYSINCIDTNTCYVAGSNYILKTVNAGDNWSTLSHYPVKPTVVPNTSKEYNVILGFTETLGAGSTGAVYYQVSNDNGATWYYLNGSNVWTATTSDANRSTVAQVNTYIPSFTGGYGSGTGQFKWKAIFYATSGTQQQKLDNVHVTIKVSPNAPQLLRIADASNRQKEVWLLALTWDAPVPNESAIDFYKIERSENGGAWHQVGTTSDAARRAYAEMVDSNSINYSYRVRAVDHDDVGDLYDDQSEPSNVVSMMPSGKFPTPPSVIGTPSVSAAATTATVIWSTDRVSSSAVNYGINTNYGSQVGSSQTEVTYHSVSLKGLMPGTTYHYKIQSLDRERTYGDDVYLPGDYTFTTTLASDISGLKISDIRADSALVSWDTNLDMASTVHYGKTKEYGSSLESGGGTSHVARLTGLEESSTYHLKISGTDGGGNLIQSDDYSFETLAFPRISNIKFEPIKDSPTSTLKVVWDTNTPTSSVVEYADAEGKKQSVSDYQLVKEHEIIISGLKYKSDYVMTLKGRDGFGNEALSESQKVTTDIDTRPPKIFEITTETSIGGYGSSTKSQMIVSWSSDEPTTSQVEYSKGGSGKHLDKVTQEDSFLTTSHAVIISGLEPSNPYFFRIITKDEAKNETKSEIKSVLTGRTHLSVFDIIIKSFDTTLGWLFGGGEFQ